MKMDAGLAVIGLPCGSFTIMRLVQTNAPLTTCCCLCVSSVSVALLPGIAEIRSRAVAGRNAITPLGNAGYGFVHCGNVLLARTALVILILCVRNARWLLEQPSNSAIMDHPVIEWLMERVPAAWLIKFANGWPVPIESSLFMVSQNPTLPNPFRYSGASSTCANLEGRL